MYCTCHTYVHTFIIILSHHCPSIYVPCVCEVAEGSERGTFSQVKSRKTHLFIWLKIRHNTRLRKPHGVVLEDAGADGGGVGDRVSDVFGFFFRRATKPPKKQCEGAIRACF